MKNIIIFGLLMIMSIGLVNAIECSLETTSSSVTMTGYYFGDATDITVNINVALLSPVGCVYSAIYLDPNGCDCGSNEIQFEVCDNTINMYSGGVQIFNSYPFTSELPMTLVYHLDTGTVTLYDNGYEQSTATIGDNLHEGYYLTLETSDASIQFISATASNCAQTPTAISVIKIATGNEYFYMQPITPTYANGYLYVSGETGILYQLTAANITADNVYPLISVANTVAMPNVWYSPIYNDNYMYGVDTGFQGDIIVSDTPRLLQYTLNGTYVAQNNNISRNTAGEYIGEGYGQYMGVDNNYLYMYTSCYIEVYDATNVTNMVNRIDFCSYDIGIEGFLYANNSIYMPVRRSTWIGVGMLQLKDLSRLADPGYIFTGTGPNEILSDLDSVGSYSTDTLTATENYLYGIWWDGSVWLLYQFDLTNASQITDSAIISYGDSQYYAQISTGGGYVYIIGEGYYDTTIYGGSAGTPVNPRSADPPDGNCASCAVGNVLLKLSENDLSLNIGELSNTYFLGTNDLTPDSLVQSKPEYYNGKIYFNDYTNLYQMNANTLVVEQTYPISGINVPWDNWVNTIQGPIYNSGSIFILALQTLNPPSSTIVQLNATDISQKIAYYTWNEYIVANPINIVTEVFWATDASSTGYWFTTCTERWVATCVAGQTVYTDARGCGTTTNKPADGASCCTELWQTYYTPTTCTGVTSRIKYYQDLDNCGTYNNFPADNGTTVVCGSGHSYANVLGWDLLMNGEPGMAAFTALNVPWGNWLVFIFWIIISLVIISKTGSWEISSIVGLIFLALFLTTPWFTGWQIGGAILFMVFQLGVVFFKMAAKEKNL